MIYDHKQEKIARPRDIVPIITAVLATEDEIDRDKEHFYSVGLDGRHRIKYVELVTLGLLDQTHVHPREVFRRAIMSACSAIIVAHNHPSEQTEPSREDIEVTQRLKTVGEIIGIDVLDHVIVTAGQVHGYYSFAEHDL